MHQGCIADGGLVKLLASHSRADNSKDARTDNCPDAERGKRPWSKGLPQRMFRFFRLADQFIDRLAGKQLARQGSSPDTDAWIPVRIPRRLRLNRTFAEVYTCRNSR